MDSHYIKELQEDVINLEDDFCIDFLPFECNAFWKGRLKEKKGRREEKKEARFLLFIYFLLYFTF